MTSSVGKEGDDQHGDGRWLMMVRHFTVEMSSVVNWSLFSSQHQRFISEARDGEPEVLWVGDNLIQNLSSSRIWDSRWERRERNTEWQHHHNLYLQLLSDALGQLWNIWRPNRERLVEASQWGAGGRLAQDHRPVRRPGELRGQCGNYSGGDQGHLCLHQEQTASSFPCSSGENPGNIWRKFLTKPL